MTLLSRQQFDDEENPPLPVARMIAIPDGAAGVSSTLNLMAHLVRQYKVNAGIRAIAEDIIRDVPAKDSAGEARAIFYYVRDMIRYTADVRDVETVKTPDAVIETAMGDCDDKSTLVATLLEAVGFTTRFVAIGFDSAGIFDHVLAQVRLGTRWVSLETTEPVEMGWQPWPYRELPPAYMVRHI